jgi:hypothetical protein
MQQMRILTCFLLMVVRKGAMPRTAIVRLSMDMAPHCTVWILIVRFTMSVTLSGEQTQSP